eukprot:gnl/TRDRNA2_/TRDRNA2_60424_c0_seq1.p1 gnl/TRDRNA2_/TRDRNA2_60424_c0~~gnl/TRDRNA2_/TRDRNA2_60424_c0_seq1.p1  ORF type:complete len:423 (+),score=84.04 gnl/TRDRNA2_/TRDRNA2_60424_c0_seq1:55-1269(+)
MERTAEVERLTVEGCSVLCLGCPAGVLFGIDYAAWQVGPKFAGVKLVPPGVHYVYTSASPDDVGVGRTGFFLCLRPRDVAVFRWDPDGEELRRLDDREEEARYADGVRGFDFDANLGPYPISLNTEWAELTRHASGGLVSRIEPIAKAVRSKRAGDGSAVGVTGLSLDDPDPCGEEDTPATDDVAMVDANESAQEVSQRATTTSISLSSQMEPNEGGGLFFTTVPRARKRKGATPSETTMLHMDRSVQLEEMLNRDYGGDELLILGELQIAYIAFLLGQNYDGFEQWKALLLLLCGCEESTVRRPGLYVELVRTFYAQLSQAPSDLFGDDLCKDNFMGSCALTLLEICASEAAPAKLRKRGEKLQELVLEKFGMSAEDLALIGEEAPLVVEADGSDLIRLDGLD